MGETFLFPTGYVDVVIVCEKGDTFHITAGKVKFENVTISNKALPEDKDFAKCLVILKIFEELPDGPMCVAPGSEMDFVDNFMSNLSEEERTAKFTSELPYTIKVTGGSVKLTNCKIDSKYGNGVLNKGKKSSMKLTQCTVNSDVLIDGATGDFVDCNINPKGGGVLVRNGGNPTMKGCFITGLEINGATGDFVDCNINPKGGGVLVRNGGNPTMKGCFITGLEINGATGNFVDCHIESGVQVKNGGNPIMKGCVFVGCPCEDARGQSALPACCPHEVRTAVFVDGSEGMFEYCVTNAICTGLKAMNGGNPTVKNCVIRGGETGVEIMKSTGTFENCVIFGGQSSAMSITEEGNPIMKKCKFYTVAIGDACVKIDKSAGTFDDCKIIKQFETNGNPTVKGCDIGDILATSGSTGTFEDCKVADFAVQEEAKPTVNNCGEVTKVKAPACEACEPPAPYYTF
ncbi:MAG: right-handed parallel beta-helix repeat-containing protein [Planctomycetia bacterium]|nr:right-handed parallel beta-helix repeat-containing protein [Planctomycetia bacterium]